PRELKRLLASEVRRTGQSLNDVAVGILASRFAVPFEPSGRPGKEPGKSGSVLLRMPAELKETLSARAALRKRKLNDLIVETLSERLGKESMPSKNGSKNGKARRSDKVRVSIVGVGNCASSLVQGVEYYKDAEPGTFVPGLMHVDLGGYRISDIEFTAAFDVTTDKVGKDLADAIWAHPNNTIKFADVPKTGITVHRVLMSIFRDRGVRVDRTFQLNFGGNADFMNMLERERLESKKISKTYSIKSTLPYELEDKNIHVGPSDHVPWLEDRKWAYIR